MKRQYKLVLLFGLVSSLAFNGIYANEIPAESSTQIINEIESASNIKVPNIEKKAKKGRINVVIDGKDVTGNIPSDQKPIITNDGITYVSIKMLETIIPETHLKYTADNKLITVNKGEAWIYIVLGKSKAYAGTQADMKEKAFDNNAVPAVAHSRTYLPLRFAVENLGCKMLWDKKTRTISISTTGAEPIIPEGIGKLEIQPDEYVRLMCDMLLKNDISDSGSEMGLSDEDINEMNKGLQKTEKDSFLKSIGDSLTQSQADRLYEAFQGALKRVNYSVKVTAQTDTTAKVVLTTDCVPFYDLVTKAAQKASKTFKGSKQECYNKYIEYLIDDLNHVKLGSTKSSTVIELVYKNGQWEAKDINEAIRKVYDAVGLGIKTAS